MMADDTWRFPFFRAAGRVPLPEREAALAAMLGQADQQLAALAAQHPPLAGVVQRMLDPQADLVATMHALEGWWDSSFRAKSLFGFLGRGRQQALTAAITRLVSYPAPDEPAADLPDNPELTALLTTLSRLALLLGQALIARRPDYRWAVEPSRPNRRSGSINAGRVVIMKQAGSRFAALSHDPFQTLGESFSRRHREHYLAPVFSGTNYDGDFAGWAIVNLANAWQE